MFGKLGQIDAFLGRGKPTANNKDVLVLKGRSIAGSTVRYAAALVLCLPGEAKERGAQPMVRRTP